MSASERNSSFKWVQVVGPLNSSVTAERSELTGRPTNR